MCLGTDRIAYLGRVIGRDGIKSNKVQSVLHWPTTTYLREVQQFLGLTNFLTNSFQSYANMTKPLTDLSRKYVQFD